MTFEDAYREALRRDGMPASEIGTRIAMIKRLMPPNSPLFDRPVIPGKEESCVTNMQRLMRLLDENRAVLLPGLADGLVQAAMDMMK